MVLNTHWLLLKCQSLLTTVLFIFTWVITSHLFSMEWLLGSNHSQLEQGADDYLTVQNQAVAMGTSFGEVILNRSNLKKQDVSIISDLRQESIGNLGKCEREKKRQVWSYYHGIPSKRNLDYNKTLLIQWYIFFPMCNRRNSVYTLSYSYFKTSYGS